jgi:hypothetical protein
MSDTGRTPKPWFESDDHALKTGYLIGYLIRQGIKFNIVRDDLGNYKPLIELVIPEEGETEPLRITVRVLGHGSEDFHVNE